MRQIILTIPLDEGKINGKYTVEAYVEELIDDLGNHLSEEECSNVEYKVIEVT